MFKFRLTCLLAILAAGNLSAQELSTGFTGDLELDAASWEHKARSSLACESAACECCQPFCDRETLFTDTRLDCLYDNWQQRKETIPIGVGAWHWFHEDLIGSNDGYGINGLRGTYWWFITADPSVEICDGKVGAHLEYRLRDGDTFRSFFDSKFWSYEAYGYLQTAGGGTLKAGQIWKRFGLDWDGVFFGNAPYFDGFKLDPDYGLSWEKTIEVDSRFKIDTFTQFFFHEDGVNGSFGGADPESVPGYNERNTGVIRVVPTWTCCDGSTLALGFSGLAGQIDSSQPGLPDDNVGAWAVDATYTKDRWKLFAEGSQAYGVFNPTRYVSGGASNKITNLLTGVHYNCGPITYRCSYSASIDDNPHAHQDLVVLGTTTKVTKNVDFYFEYVFEQVHGNANQDVITFFNSLEFIVYWHF